MGHMLWKASAMVPIESGDLSFSSVDNIGIIAGSWAGSVLIENQPFDTITRF